MPSPSQPVLPNPKVLLTGATGYVGGRLLKAFQHRGLAVRCLTRRPEVLRGRLAPGNECVFGDVTADQDLSQALAGIETAYYLVHSMGATGDFEDIDRRAAERFAAACRQTRVNRIVYLGGLSDDRGRLSPHLRSRHEVGDILRGSGVPTLEFRASIILGSGSLSFEMVRALVERLPVMVTPRWVSSLAQPIAIEDVIQYLVAAREPTAPCPAVIEIGGPDRLSYGGLMQLYAGQRGLRRWMIPVPVLTPRLSSLWLGLVTPLYARVGRNLLESMRSSSVVMDPTGMRHFAVRPMGVVEAMERALKNEDQECAETRWSDALSSSGHPATWGGVRWGNRLVDTRRTLSESTPEDAFTPIRQLGGRNGWYASTFLWKLRGWMDLLVGGVGLRRGRRDPEHLRIGDPLDFWRVEAFDPPQRLRLAAEMRLPGRAWLEFVVKPVRGGSEIVQTAIFDPAGVAGLIYWYALYPLHQIVFSGLLREIARRAGHRSRQSARR